MGGLDRRLKKLETQLTDPSGLVPHTQRWLDYWDRQLYLFLTEQDEKRFNTRRLMFFTRCFPTWTIPRLWLGRSPVSMGKIASDEYGAQNCLA